MRNTDLDIKLGRIAEEFANAYRAGKKTSVDEWIKKYPDLPAGELKQQLEMSIALIETAKEPFPTQPLSAEAENRIKENMLAAYDELYGNAVDFPPPVGEEINQADNYHKQGIQLLREGKLKEAKDYFLKVIDLLPEVPQPYYHLGEIAFKQDDLLTAEKMSLKSLELSESQNDEVGLLINSQRLGEIYAIQKKYKDAEIMFQRALSFSTLSEDKKWKAYIHEKLSEAYMNQKNYILALDNSHRALSLYEEVNDKTTLMSGYFNLATILKEKKDYDKSIEFYQSSLELALEIDNESFVGRIQAIIGEIFSCTGEPKSAETFYREAIPLLEKIGNKDLLPNSYYNLGEILANRLDYDNAVQEYQKALALAKETNDLSLQGLTYGALAEIFAQQGNFNKANEYSRKATDIYGKLSGQKGRNVKEAFNESLNEMAFSPLALGNRGIERLDWETLKIGRNYKEN